MIVVDSSVWIDFLRPRPTQAVGRLRVVMQAATEQIIVGDIVLLEVLQGARDELLAIRLERDLRAYTVKTMIGEELALVSARNYRALRRKGVTIRKPNDMIIGTFCIANNYTLLQDDRDFLPMAQHLGLRLI